MTNSSQIDPTVQAQALLEKSDAPDIGPVEKFQLVADAFQIAPKSEALDRLLMLCGSQWRWEDLRKLLELRFEKDRYSLMAWIYYLRVLNRLDDRDTLKKEMSWIQEQSSTFGFGKYLEFAQELEQNTKEAIYNKVVSTSAHSDCPSLIISMTMFGETHVDLFFQLTYYCISSNGNIGALSQSFDFHFFVFTDAKTRAYINEKYDRRLELLRAEFVVMPDLFMSDMTALPHQDALNKYYKIMAQNVGHYACLEIARRQSCLYMPIWPDHIFAHDYFKNVLGAVSADGVQAVAVPAWRVHKDKVDAVLNENPMYALFRTGGLSGAEIESLVCEIIPREFFVDHKPFTSFPLFFCWPLEGQSFMFRGASYAPACINGQYLKSEILLKDDPIDGEFLDTYLQDVDQVAYPYTGGVSLVDVGTSPLLFSEDTFLDAFSVRELADRVPYLKLAHNRKTLFVSGVYPSDIEHAQIGQVNAEADETLEELLNYTKSFWDTPIFK